MRLHSSPWGPVQHQTEEAPGIWRVDTASHGGFFLTEERWARVQQFFPSQQRYAPAPWLEEDCDWALAVLAWPELFDARICYYAVLTFSGDGDYCKPTKAWLATPAADYVKAKAAQFNPEAKRPPVAAAPAQMLLA